ncbi:YnbE family lipoprotein [Pseudohongiella acticola]|jgi:YnbE-like lipoprotein|uniref:YnbE family lipoprotein n=1 Tax=Pseudohongiella acticola TaxID=1524254 RepID=UPI003C6E47B2
MASRRTLTAPGPHRTLTLPGLALALPVMLAGMIGCTPTVRVEAPTEPITINLNVRIEHEIRVRVDRELDDIFSADSGLF